MVGADTFKDAETYDEFEGYQRNLKVLSLAIRRVDELVRLLEIRVEELERVNRKISVSITLKKQIDRKRGSLDDE